MMNLDLATEHAEVLFEQQQTPQALIDTDWAAEWKRVQLARKHVDSAERWDKRAPSFGLARAVSPYVTQFVDLLDLREGDTVLDMGCGNGAVAIPLAQAGHHVVARDFSQGMLRELAGAVEAEGVQGRVDFARMAWEDDWEQAGILPRSVDVAFASRSVITTDLGEALAKLTRTARRHCAVTVSTGYTPMMSPTMLRELGVHVGHTFDFVYVFNILVQQGHQPDVRYIVHDRVFHFNSAEEAKAQFSRLLEHAGKYCDAAELEFAATRLDAWISGSMQANGNAGCVNHHGEVEGAYKIVMPGDVRWAFLRWDV